ncbi:MAG: dehydrogenase [Synechococcaceae cyanobacterium]
MLNTTIDRYAYAVIRTLDRPIIRLVASDRQIEAELDATQCLELCGELDLHKSVYNYFVKNFNEGSPLPLELTTFCDAPVGSGLGASSTLVVAMIRAFVELLNAPLDDYAIAHLAFHIERVECGLQGGRQDQYSATFGGFNFMEFHAEQKTVVTPLRIKDWVLCELEASLVLFYTGVSRESAAIISEQSAGVASGDARAIDAIHGIKQEALVMKESLLRGDFGRLVESMRVGWENKKRSAHTVSNRHLEQVFESAIDAGALAGKASGAGGGGFMLFFVPTEKRMSVIRALSGFKGEVRNCHFTEQGAQAWRV